MFFTRVIPALFVAAATAQALYIPNVLDAREFEESNEIAARGLDHLNVVRDLTFNDDVMVLTARDFTELGLRSEDVLSQILITRNPPYQPYYKQWRPQKNAFSNQLLSWSHFNDLEILSTKSSLRELLNMRI